METTFLFWLFPVLLVVAALFDLTTLTIPNKVNLAIGAAFVPMMWLLPVDIDLLISHVGAGFIVFVVTVIFFGLGWIGGGDSKMASAIALWLGLGPLLEFVLYTALAGGVLALVFVLWNFIISRPMLKGFSYIATAKKRKRVPYGVALAAGGIIAYQLSIWAMIR